MATRYFISKEEAQKILYTQMDYTLFACFFADGYNDAELIMPIEDVIEETEFSILEENGEYKLDWKNSIGGLGSHYWGHDPLKLENNPGFMHFNLGECEKEIED